MIKYHCWTTYEYFHPCYLRICHLNVLHVARFKVIITFWLTFNGFFCKCALIFVTWNMSKICCRLLLPSYFFVISEATLWFGMSVRPFSLPMSIQYIIDFVRMSVFLQKTFTYIFKGFVIIFFLLDDIILAI